MKSLLKSIVVSILTLEARIALKRHRPHVVAVTGNVGKTSTKDCIYAVLSHGLEQGSVRKSEKSMNSEIGLPLAILGLDNAWSSASGWMANLWEGLKVALGVGTRAGGARASDFPEWLVLEVGADHPGDIERVAKWLRPDIAVLTRMSDVPVHVEYFKDATEVLREKMFLAQAVKAGGAVVVNADDHHWDGPVAALMAARGDVKKVSYGQKKGSDAHIVESGVSYRMDPLPLPVGQRGVIRMDKDAESAVEAKIELEGVLGGHLIYPVAAACAVALVVGVRSSVERAFKDFEAPKGRMRVLDGLNGCALIDDTYNSSPLACAEALDSLAGLTLKGKKFAVLGDMKELGANAERAHRDIGRLAGHSMHTVVTVGDMARFIALGAIDAGLSPERVLSFDDSEAAGAALRDLVRAGDVVLIKGSQSMRMEKATKALLAHPERAVDLLVRQEEEWGKR